MAGTKTMKKMKNNLLLLTCAAVVAACTPTMAQRGNMLEDAQIEEVVPAVHTRSDVLRILGSPTTQAPFNENIWYYIGQKTAKSGILDPEVIEEKIYVVAFDENGILQRLEKVEADRLDIPFARSKTPTHGTNLTFTQQLLGNLGRFNTQAPQQ